MGSRGEHERSSEDNDTAGTTASGFSRRQVLAGGAAGLGGLAAAGLLPGVARAAGGGTGYQSVPERGKALKVVWANGAIADWNLSYDVGSNDAARFLGWQYKKVGLPQTTYSASQVLKVLNQVIQLRPDVMIAPFWVKGEADVFAKAQKAGIYVAVNNAVNFPDDLTQLGIPAATSNPDVLGRKSATVLVEALTAAGKKDGSIVIGNPYPQNPNQQGVADGAQAVIKAWNAAHKTTFKGTQLNDNSGDDVVKAIGLWKAKITQLGSDFIGGFAVADTTTQAAVRAYQQSHFKAGQYPLAAVDVTTKSLDYVKQDWVLCLVDAGFYMQGWLPVMFAWQTLHRGFPASGAIDASGAPITKKTLSGFNKANALQVKLGKDYGVALK
jgi:ABC-type sugar transport system substrate-binding protein